MGSKFDDALRVIAYRSRKLRYKYPNIESDSHYALMKLARKNLNLSK